MKRRGSTIFESVIYMALMVVIMGALVTFMVDILRRETKILTMLEVNQNARFALEKVTAAVRNAKDATSPADGGGSGSTLILTMADVGLSPTVFAVTDGVLTMTQGVNPPVALTSSAVAVASINFTNLIDPIYHLRTEPYAVACQDNQNKRLICHAENTQCVNKNSALAEGDRLGPCWEVTSAKSIISIQMTVASPPEVGPGNEFASTITIYDSVAVPRQN